MIRNRNPLHQRLLTFTNGQNEICLKILMQEDFKLYQTLSKEASRQKVTSKELLEILGFKTTQLLIPRGVNIVKTISDIPEFLKRFIEIGKGDKEVVNLTRLKNYKGFLKISKLLSDLGLTIEEYLLSTGYEIKEVDNLRIVIDGIEELLLGKNNRDVTITEIKSLNPSYYIMLYNRAKDLNLSVKEFLLNKFQINLVLKRQSNPEVILYVKNELLKIANEKKQVSMKKIKENNKLYIALNNLKKINNKTENSVKSKVNLLGFVLLK